MTDLLEQALALHRRGAVAEAAAGYADVLRGDPDNTDAHYYLGMIACQNGRFAEGAESARKSLAGDPRHVRAHVLLGRALTALGRHEEALSNFESAIEFEPDAAPAHAHRGDVLSELGRNAEAIDSYDRALALAPDSFADWLNRGAALIAAGRHQEAVSSIDRAIALKPDFADAHLWRAPRLLSKLHICDWTNLDAEVAEFLTTIEEQKPSSVPFATLVISSSPADQLRYATRYVQAQPAYPQLWQGEAYAHERLRIAYLSADFYEHATAYLTAGLFEQHDRSRFEVTAISFGPDDNSPMRHRLESALEHFIDVRGKNGEDIAALIREREIDIAVDLMGFTKHSRADVLARRAAPIQVSYLGYPGTMGASYIDYIMADPTTIPESEQQFYAEQVVRLPGTYQINDNRRRISERMPSRAECGLPENAFVFCCFNNTYKITPAIFDIWMRLLTAAENSVLWLYEANAAASANLRREAEKRGVSSQRLIFAPKISPADHLARHRLADLFLDTLTYNAHTTASDALWAGLPVLTCLGPTFAGRVAGSLLKAAGLDDLVTQSLAEYHALALKLAGDRSGLAAIRHRLALNRDTFPLFDTARTTRHIEAAYLTMAEIRRRGEPPRGFNVASRGMD